MTDQEMNKLIFYILAFVDINYAVETRLSATQLNEQYKAISQELSFGAKTVRTYRTMLADAMETKAKIMGATNWIGQTYEAKTTPEVRKNLDTIMEMGPTKGALYEGNELTQWQHGSGWS